MSQPGHSTEPVVGDAVRTFAAELRTAKVTAGDPTIAALVRETGVSKTVLTEALQGRRLPSARTVAALASAFGGDVHDWLARRDAIARAETPTVEAAGPAAALPDPVPTEVPSQGLRRTRVVVAWSAAAFVTGALLATFTTLALTGPTVAAPVTAPTGTATPTSPGNRVLPVRSGVDPADTTCVDDAVVAASEIRARGTQLQVIWSASCHAAWARITRFDGESSGNAVSASIFRQVAPTASDRQETTEPDAQSAYTTLLVRPTPETTLCASGSITVGGSDVPLGDPVCL